MAIFCQNVIFILNLTPGFNGLAKGNCKTRWQSLKFPDLVCLILEILRYIYNIGSDLLWLNHCGLVMPYGDIGLQVNIGSGNGLLPDCKKLLLYLKYTQGWFQACAQSMREMLLQCNIISYWLGANLESALTPETMLTSRLWGSVSVTFTWEQFHSKCPSYYYV